MFQVARGAVAVVVRVAVAVALAGLRVFARDVQGRGQLAGREHVQGLLRKGVVALHRAAGIHVAAEPVHFGEQLLAVLQSLDADAAERQVGLAVGVGRKCPIGRAEKARVPRRAVGRMAGWRRQAHERRNARSSGPLQFGQRRTDRRPAAGGLLADRSSGVADKRVVVAAGRAIDRAERHQFVHDPRQPGQVLADLDAGHAGRNRPEIAANFGRSLHFQVEHVLVRRGSAQVDHDDRLARAGHPLGRLGPQQIAEANPPNPRLPMVSTSRRVQPRQSRWGWL